MMENKTAAAYIRVSTDDQLDYSPSSQLDEIKEYAKLNGFHIPEEYIFMESEGYSGKRAENRPEFQKMIATAKLKPKPFNAILVWKFSRFARNQDESTFYKGMLRKKLEIDVISISEPIIDGMYGRLIETIIEWQDEFYSYNLAMEVTRGMTKKAELGEPQVAPPLGYRIPYKGSAPEIVPEEAEVVKLIFKMFLEGTGVFGIARHLTDCGITGKRGGSIRSTAIEKMLENPYYAGYSRWNGIIAKGDFPAIIEENIFRDVQKRLKRSTKPKYSKPEELSRHWLSGVVCCSSCGRTMTSQIIRSAKCDYTIFQCGGYTRGVCKTSHYVRENKLEKAVLVALEKILKFGTVSFVIRQSNIDSLAPSNLIQTQIKNTNLKLSRIRNSYMAGIDTLEEYKASKTSLIEELQHLEMQLEQSRPNTAKSKEKILSNIQNAYNIIVSSDYDTSQKNAAIKSVVEKVIFSKDRNHIDILYYLDESDIS